MAASERKYFNNISNFVFFNCIVEVCVCVWIFRLLMIFYFHRKFICFVDNFVNYLWSIWLLACSFSLPFSFLQQIPIYAYTNQHIHKYIICIWFIYVYIFGPVATLCTCVNNECNVCNFDEMAEWAGEGCGKAGAALAYWQNLDFLRIYLYCCCW